MLSQVADRDVAHAPSTQVTRLIRRQAGDPSQRPRDPARDPSGVKKNAFMSPPDRSQNGFTRAAYPGFQTPINMRYKPGITIIAYYRVIHRVYRLSCSLARPRVRHAGARPQQVDGGEVSYFPVRESRARSRRDLATVPRVHACSVGVST